jgi:hypothetical protein
MRIRDKNAWRQTYHMCESLQNSVMKNMPVDLCTTTHSRITDHAITDAWFLENKALILLGILNVDHQQNTGDEEQLIISIFINNSNTGSSMSSIAWKTSVKPHFSAISTLKSSSSHKAPLNIRRQGLLLWTLLNYATNSQKYS